MKLPSILALAAAAALTAGCDDHAGHNHPHGTGHDHGHDHGQDGDHDHKHAHEAPHGGALIALGDEFAHVELLVDAATGKITAWILDGHAENPIRISRPTLEFRVTSGPEGLKDLLVPLLPVAKSTTGETADSTSEFSTTHDRFKGVTKFEGVLTSVTIKSKDFADVKFKYPEGNE